MLIKEVVTVPDDQLEDGLRSQRLSVRSKTESRHSRKSSKNGYDQLVAVDDLE